VCGRAAEDLKDKISLTVIADGYDPGFPFWLPGRLEYTPDPLWVDS
jgi:hypothetical protein